MTTGESDKAKDDLVQALAAERARAERAEERLVRLGVLQGLAEEVEGKPFHASIRVLVGKIGF